MTHGQRFKAIFRSAGSVAWFIVSTFLIILLAVVTVLENTILNPILTTVLGGPMPILGEDSLEIYKSDYKNKAESTDAGDELNVKIAEEGFVLLMNEGNTLPLTTSSSNKAKVSVFGHNSVDLVLGGSGSGGTNAEDAVTLYDSLAENNFEYNPTLKSFYESGKAGDVRTETALTDATSTSPVLKIGETPWNNYDTATKRSMQQYNDAAIVVISRVGGESFDLPRTQSGDPEKHYLELDNNELDMLDHVTSMYDKVIVLLNTLQAFQCDFIDRYNTANETGIDAMLWIGGPGTTGATAIGEILSGAVNPSGKTTDIYARDFTKDPTWQNFGDNSQSAAEGDIDYDNSGNSLGNTAYLEGTAAIKGSYNLITYEEGVYTGYRYYETRGFVEAENGNADWYDENVIFPFGYGLSYTEFNQTIDKVEIKGADGTVKSEVTDADDQIIVTVTIKNVGNKEGKGIVELYVSKPYYEGGIEKSQVELVDFAKTAENLATDGSDSSQTFTFTIDAYDLASYDNYDANGNDFRGYELEDGEYTLYVSSDSHVTENMQDVQTFEVAAEGENTTENGLKWTSTAETVDGTVVENLYTYVGEGVDYYSLDYRMDTVIVNNEERKGMTRTDFEGSFPTPLTKEERKVSLTTDINGLTEKQALENMAHNNTEVEAAAQTPVRTGVDSELTLRDLLSEQDLNGTLVRTGKEGYQLVSYDDEAWDELLDSLTFGEMVSLVNNGAYQTVAISSIGKNLTNDSDGPIGFVNFMPGLLDHYKGNTIFACEIVVGCTWNRDLAYQMGKAVGENGLWGDVGGNGLPYTGWYAPAINLHRSPFSGRNFEYYSEDPILSGKLAVSVINGCKTKGVYTDLKHFALNDQETNRTGVSTFCTEQALREIYLKPFEIAVKGDDDPNLVPSAVEDGWAENPDGFEGTTGVMSSFNRIGNRWTGGDYKLLTTILRNEWGFNGLVICDYKTDNEFMDARQMVYAGNDLILASLTTLQWTSSDPMGGPDSASNEDMYVLRKAAKNILYTVANSNAIQLDIVGYGMEWWRTLTIVLDVVIPVGIAVWGFFAIRKAFRKAEKNSLDSDAKV